MSMRNDWTDIAISWPVAMLILVIGAYVVVREPRTERAPYNVNPDAICRNAALDRMARELGTDTTRMGCGL